MPQEQSKQILEAAIFAASEPVTFDKLLSIVRVQASKVKQLLAELEEEYKTRGVELKKVASGYRFQVRQDYARNIQKLYEKNPPKYSRALLETLALIAYRQPITRGEIEEVRGVVVSSKIIKILEEREWIKIVGHRDVPGKPALFATTKQFLDYFNLRTLNDLPSLEKVADFEKAEQQLTEQLTLAVSGVKPSDMTQLGHQEDAIEVEPQSVEDKFFDKEIETEIKHNEEAPPDST